ITPSDAEGRVDETGLRRLLERLAEAQVDSVGLLGSTGTYAYLSRDERRRAVTIAAEVVDGRVPILVGIGALRTDEAIRLARDARAAGADAGL
ncbi:dihydrodipicolinate synthase family protein, partial [Acinetobacter baumannii]|uniref:dihydrodipicolinate synthase family protein n=1 Tax=Acinetobacter baumannii TaxID=470 RepID=UPI00241D7ADB